MSCNGSTSSTQTPCISRPDEAELRRQLAEIEAAISALQNGTRLTELRVGSAEFFRSWKYTEISLDNLYAERKRLLDALAALTSCIPFFRTNAHIPLIITRRKV